MKIIVTHACMTANIEINSDSQISTFMEGIATALIAETFSEKQILDAMEDYVESRRLPNPSMENNPATVS